MRKRAFIFIISSMICIELRGMNDIKPPDSAVRPQARVNQLTWVVGAAYYIIHHHQKSRHCWRHCQPSIAKIKSKNCGEKEPALESYFKTQQPVIVFYTQDKQPIVAHTLFLDGPKKKLKKIAEQKLDPQVKPLVASGLLNDYGQFGALYLYDKDGEEILCWPTLDYIFLPLAAEIKKDMAEFVDISELSDEGIQLVTEILKQAKKKKKEEKRLVKAAHKK